MFDLWLAFHGRGIDGIESRVVRYWVQHHGLVWGEVRVWVLVVIGLEIDEFSVDFFGGLLKAPYFFFASWIAI